MKIGMSNKSVETTLFLYLFKSCNQFATHAKFGGERKKKHYFSRVRKP
jgi:hypothetical protein